MPANILDKNKDSFKLKIKGESVISFNSKIEKYYNEFRKELKTVKLKISGGLRDSNCTIIYLDIPNYPAVLHREYLQINKNDYCQITKVFNEVIIILSF